jgi:hypothetical protein
MGRLVFITESSSFCSNSLYFCISSSCPFFNSFCNYKHIIFF